MNISIEAHVLNHHQRSGLMTYTEGLVYGMGILDQINNYSLLYYSLSRNSKYMPGPEAKNLQKIVLRVPDREFLGRQWLIDKVILPAFFKSTKTRIFHRTSGYTMPSCKNIFRILTVHDLRTLTIGDNLWKQNIDHYRKTINALDACVVVSECTKKDIIEHLKVDEKRIKVIYLGADKRFQPASQESINKVRVKYGLKDPFLFSVGSVPRKNIDGIIKAFAASTINHQFLLVLSCNKDLDQYMALVNTLGMKERVVFLSKLDDSEVVTLYSACHAFVFPSLYEGFGLPILEAMQCGAAVITSNLSSCPEVAGDAAIFVNPHKTNEIADAINQICTNNSLRNDLVIKGFARSKLFNWNKYAQEMLQIYQKA